MRLALLLTIAILSRAQTAQFLECRASFDGSRLTISNALIERQWQWRNGQLYATSFKDFASKTEWLDKSNDTASPVSKNASQPANAAPTFSTRSGPQSSVQAPSLIAELATDTGVNYRFQIFPAARGVLQQILEPKGTFITEAAAATQAATGIETSTAAKFTPSKSDVQDALALAAEHLRLTQVTLLDQTDIHNQLVFEKSWLLPHRNEGALRLDGNLFIAENTLTHAGLVFLKLAPLPHARPIKSAWDLEVFNRGRGVQLTLVGNGVEPDGGPAYQSIVLAYTNGFAGRTEALQTFQRQLRTYLPDRDGKFLSNTWGDRSRDLRINQDFMRREIAAGAKLGVDIIQIDDGWQTGRTANSAKGSGVWTGYWAQNPNFWVPDSTRFADGISALVKQAAASKLYFGLWFGPDSSNDFSNWQRDADLLLSLHRNDGIDYFKIDGVKAVTKPGERNLRRLFDRVLQGSNGRVAFDLDVTAETRPGYFGMPDVGPIFVENRYTDFHGYFPHQTLRNLWQLAAYVDPQRLRMEVLNNARNPKLYDGDPLAPSAYQPDHLFATVMFANPLGWFEMSNLPPAYAASMSKLVATWKQHREALFQSTILPIGEAPDGTNWTGFSTFGKANYLLLFRGVGAPETWSTELKGKSATILAGTGAVKLNGGSATITIPKAPGFVWAEIR